MWSEFDLGVWYTLGFAVFDPDEGLPVWNVVTEVVVEASASGASLNFLGKVDLIDLCGEAAAFFGPVPAEVPFADAGGIVALFFEHAWEGEAVFLDEWAFPLSDDASFQAAAPRVAAS